MNREIKFLKHAVKIFNLFDQKTRDRILEYLCDRYYKRNVEGPSCE